MQFDSADLAALETDGGLLPVILHEMAHVMGFGTVWTYNNVYANNTGHYIGVNALATYKAEFNQPGATFVPVELGGGPGTKNSHWNELDGGACCTGIVSAQGDMTYELMTGWLNLPDYFISDTTVESFVDIGYSTAVVPEPTTLLLLSIGVCGLIGQAWRRRH